MITKEKATKQAIQENYRLDYDSESDYEGILSNMIVQIEEASQNGAFECHFSEDSSKLYDFAQTLAYEGGFKVVLNNSEENVHIYWGYNDEPGVEVENV